MYFRVESSGPRPYLQIVESYGDGKRVRQRVLGALGRVESLEESGELDPLIRSELWLCQPLAPVDAQSGQEYEAAALRRIDPDLVFGRLWERIGSRKLGKAA